MLSPGNWHERVPRELTANLRYRAATLEECRRPRVRPSVIRRCQQDILYYINTFVWQYNPNRAEEIDPFITWDFQAEAIRVILDCIDERRDLVIEKSREMGASWLCLIIMEWLWHFHGNKKFLMVSRNADAVDKPGDSDSLFWKLDFIHRHQPDWLIKPYLRRRKFSFRNLKNGSSMTGQASTGKAGVGGRATAMFVDEFAQIDEAYEILQRTSDTTRCRIFNSTHLGTDTAFYELTDPNSILGAFIKKLRMHWTQHPEKVHGLYQYQHEPHARVEMLDKAYVFPPDFEFVRDGKVRSPWYDEQCKRKGSPRAIAMDLDIDPAGSVSQFFNSSAVLTLIRLYCRAPDWEGDLDYDRDSGRPHALAERKGGQLKLWCQLPDGRPPFGRYGVGCDVAAGMGATPSVITVTDAETGEKVAEYVNSHIEPSPLAPLLVALCWLFRTEYGDGAMLAWECPGPGLVLGKRIVELGYRNIYLRYQEDRLTRQVSEKWGWFANPNAKRVLMEEYRDALTKRQFLNHSEPAMEETKHFRYNGRGEVVHGSEDRPNDPSGARVNHSDRVIADALSWMMCKSYYKERKRQKAEEAPVLSLLWRRRLAEKRRLEEAEL